MIERMLANEAAFEAELEAWLAQRAANRAFKRGAAKSRNARSFAASGGSPV